MMDHMNKLATKGEKEDIKRFGQVVNALTNSPKQSDEGTRKKSPGIKKDASKDRLKKE